MELPRSSALIVIDVQKDFLPGGSLPVSDGNEVIPPLQALAQDFARLRLPVFATRCWHPAEHCSFKAQGGRWPPHCVAGSEGARFAWTPPLGAQIISKGMLLRKEAYSDFDGTDLDERLRSLGVRTLFVGGLATEYCVLYTVLDGLKLGYRVYVLEDAVRAVNVERGDDERAFARMKSAGARVISSRDIDRNLERMAA